MPSSGLWKRAEPGWRSEADMQRAEARRAEANVKREGVGGPERVSARAWATPTRRAGINRPARHGARRVRSHSSTTRPTASSDSAAQCSGVSAVVCHCG